MQFKDGPLERVASQTNLEAAVKEIGDLPRQRGELIGVERQCPEVGELAYFGGQHGELIVVESQVPEAGEQAYFGGQRSELIVVEPQVPEAGELADLRGQRGEFSVRQITAAGPPEFLELGFRDGASCRCLDLPAGDVERFPRIRHTAPDAVLLITVNDG